MENDDVVLKLIENSIQLESQQKENNLLHQEIISMKETESNLIQKIEVLEELVQKYKQIAPAKIPKKISRVKFDEVSAYGYNHNHMLDTAVIVITGEQFEKYEAIMKMTNRQCVSSKTYYRYLPLITNIIKKVFEEEQEKLIKEIKELHTQNKLGSLLVAIDAGWNKRGPSELGNFFAVLMSSRASLNNKVIWQASKSFSRTKQIKGKDVIVHEGKKIKKIKNKKIMITINNNK